MKQVCTSKDYIKFITYCREYIHKLRLDQWDVEYKFQTRNQDKLADTSMAFGTLSAIITLYAEWGEDVTDITLHEVAYHEVLHLLFAEYFEDASDHVSDKVLRQDEHKIIKHLSLAAFRKRKK